MSITPPYQLREYLGLPQHSEPWLIEPLIPAGGMVCLYGLPKTRKSFLAIQLARDIVQGQRFLGFATTQATVLYMQLDTPRSLWQARLQTLAQTPSAGFTPAADTGLYIADAEHVPHPFHFVRPDVSMWMRQQVEAVAPGLVIVDVIRKVFRGSDNDSDVIEETLAAMQQACKPAAVLVVAHSRKAGEHDTGTLGEMRGSGAQAASYDTILRLQKGGRGGTPTLSIEGRATEDRVIRLANRDDLLFDLAGPSAFEAALESVLAKDYPSQRAKAHALAEVTGESFDKCHAAVRRRQG